MKGIESDGPLWARRHFHQRRFALSERRPILANMTTYPQKEKVPDFDMHYDLEMGIVLEGRMHRYCAESQVTCSSGDAWLCGMWEPHGFHLVQAPCTVVVLVIWPPFLANLHFPEAPRIHWLRPFVGTNRVAFRDSRQPVAIARQMVDCARRDQDTERLRLRLLLIELLLIIMKENPGDPRLSVEPPSVHSEVSPALELAFRSKRLVTNVEAAKLCGMSRDSFIRQFRKVMGVSFAKFALRHRLSGAAEALVSTLVPIKAVAAEWGFTDESHLNRLFVRHYGLTPLKYRKAIGHGSEIHA